MVKENNHTNPFTIPGIKTVNIYTNVNNTKDKWTIKEIDKLTPRNGRVPVIHCLEVLNASNNMTETPDGTDVVNEDVINNAYLTLVGNDNAEQILEDGPLSVLDPTNYNGRRFMTNIKNPVLGSSYFHIGDKGNFPATNEAIVLVVYYTYE